MGDDTNPGRGLMEMIPPEACMDKHEGLSMLDEGGIISMSPRPGVVSLHYNRARPASNKQKGMHFD